jgi:gamma-glutamyltranspeptidase/glutathione hydrolase
MPLVQADPSQRVTIAASSKVAADAAAYVADRGGNAVDAALAATLTSLCVDVGLVAPAGSGFIHVWPRDEKPVLIDAYAEVPGRGLGSDHLSARGDAIYMEYGGGVTTMVGYGSVATPGVFLGLAKASKRYGALPWKEVFEPVIQIVEKGFALPPASLRYLHYSGEPVFGWQEESRAALFRPDGTLRTGDDLVHIPALAETLRRIASEGAGTLHGGALGQAIVDDVRANGGSLTMEDLLAYEAIERDPVKVRAGDWEIAVNPAPAYGGVTVGALMLLLEGYGAWGAADVRRMVAVQRGVLDYRQRRLEGKSDVERAAEDLIAAARRGELPDPGTSPSTIHTSAVDADGLACSITASAGYGSGAMAADTGMWLNNSLGELDLLGEDVVLEPGLRLQSNMAPTIARRDDGAMLAVGSPGASRIATAIAQVLANFIHAGLPLWDAIQAPRLHVEDFEGSPTVAREAGLVEVDLEGYEVRSFPGTDMYFGGVQAVLGDGTSLSGAADPRRDGAVASGGRR